MPLGRLVFRAHALRRMFQRGIRVEQVRHVLSAGDIVETYPDDTPYPSRLILGWVGNRPLHIVAAHNVEADETIVITVYEPDPSQWEQDFMRRKT